MKEAYDKESAGDPWCCHGTQANVGDAEQHYEPVGSPLGFSHWFKWTRLVTRFRLALRPPPVFPCPALYPLATWVVITDVRAEPG